MTELSKTVRLRIGMWYAKNMLQLEQGYNAEFSHWDKQNNECTMTITCFDDYPDPRFRKNKDDLQSYLVRKFGSMIIKDARKPSALQLTMAAKGLPLTHPLLKQDKKDYPSFQDNFKEEYILDLTKAQMREANSTLNNNEGRLKPEKIKQTSDYVSDIYQLRMGIWR